MNIVRNPTRAEGGITEKEKIALDAHAQMWIKRIMRTEPADRVELTRAIEDLYQVAGLEKPNVVIVNSPIVMAAAYGAAAAIWHQREQNPGVDIALPSFEESMPPTEEMGVEKAAIQTCFNIAGEFGLECMSKWDNSFHGGAYWAHYDSFLTAMRDVIGLRLPEHEAYEPWERAAIHGTFRVMHEKFCIVSDFPEVLMVDENDRPHCENGPSHMWRDGWELYHWHGVQVPKNWIMDRENVDPSEILQEENVEKRSAGAEIIGWVRMASALDMKVIDGDTKSDIGALVEMTLPGLDQPGRFLMAQCPRNGTICEGVPNTSDIDNLPINTAIAAQAWRIGDPQSEYTHPERRT